MERIKCIILLRDFNVHDKWHVYCGSDVRHGTYVESYRLPFCLFGRSVVDCYINGNGDGQPNIIWVPCSELDINIEWVYK